MKCQHGSNIAVISDFCSPRGRITAQCSPASCPAPSPVRQCKLSLWRRKEEASRANGSFGIAKQSGGCMLFQRISKTRTCPVCSGGDAYRVRRAGFPVKVVCKLLNLRPHWCPDCDTFFLGPKSSREQRRVESSMPESRTTKTGSGAQPHAGNA